MTVHPTEESEGEKTYACSLCGDIRTEPIDKLSHTHKYGEWMTVKEPSCSAEGQMIRTCPCGQAEGKALDKIPHTWDAGTITLAPTADREGVMRYTCQGCQETRTEALEKLHKHEFGKWVVVIKAGCESRGLREKSCRCGDVWQEAIEPKGHTYDHREIVKEPSVKEEGLMRHTCSACQESYTEPIAKLDSVPNEVPTEQGTVYYEPSSLSFVQSVLIYVFVSAIVVAIVGWFVLKRMSGSGGENGHD